MSRKKQKKTPPKMSGTLEAIQKLVTCPFCSKKFTGAVKLIPECGQSICGHCYEDLGNAMDGSKEYKCQACSGYHALPDSEYQDCKLVLDLLSLTAEKPLTPQAKKPLTPRAEKPLTPRAKKPLTPQAKKLQLVIESVQEELTRLHSFDANLFIIEHCDELAVQVAEAAESAVKHIKEIENDLLTRIDEYRLRHLNGSTTTRPSSASSCHGHQLQQQASIDKTQKELDALTQEINRFSNNWKQEHFSRLSGLKSEAEVDAALAQAGAYRTSLNELDRKLRVGALNETMLLFNANVAFHAKRDHLGELVEMAAGITRGFTIEESPSKTMTGHSGWIRQAIFLPDGRLASCSDDDTIKVWDTASGQELFTLSGHTSWVSTIASIPNGWLASGSLDKTIKLWDLEARKEVRTLSGHSELIIDLKVLKNGQLVSCSDDDTIKVWNPYLSESNLILTLQGHGNEGFHIPMGVLSNQQLVSCSLDCGDKEESMLRVWDYNAGKLVKSLLTGLKAVIVVLALSNDQVAIGDDDGTIKIIDLEDDQKSRVKQKAHDVYVSCLLQLPNDNLVSAGRDIDSSGDIFSIKVWKFADLSLLQNIKTDHSESIELSISPDETLLASSSGDETIKLWTITES